MGGLSPFPVTQSFVNKGGRLYPVTHVFKLGAADVPDFPPYDPDADFAFVLSFENNIFSFKSHSFSMHASQPVDLTIAWGDGTETTISRSSTSTLPDAIVSFSGHTYPNNDGKELYTVSIKKYKSGYFYFRGVTELKHVLMPLPKQTGRKRYQYCFQGCSSLVSVPEDLFINCGEAEDFQNLFDFDYELTGQIPDFSYCPNAYNFKDGFYRCSKLTGAAPPLWLRSTEPAMIGMRCFYECTQLSNYQEIPDDWKYFL